MQTKKLSCLMLAHDSDFCEAVLRCGHAPDGDLSYDLKQILKKVDLQILVARPAMKGLHMRIPA
jgi:hypothetical protein